MVHRDQHLTEQQEVQESRLADVVARLHEHGANGSTEHIGAANGRSILIGADRWHRTRVRSQRVRCR